MLHPILGPLTSGTCGMLVKKCRISHTRLHLPLKNLVLPWFYATYVGLTLKNAGYTAHLLLKSAGDVVGWTKSRLFLRDYMQVLHKNRGIYEILSGSYMRDIHSYCRRNRQVLYYYTINAGATSQIMHWLIILQTFEKNQKLFFNLCKCFQLLFNFY